MRGSALNIHIRDIDRPESDAARRALKNAVLDEQVYAYLDKQETDRA